MKNLWIKLNIEIESSNTNFTQTINVHDMINTDYSRLMDDSILDSFKKAMKACNGKFDMLTISIKKSNGYTYYYDTVQQYRFIGKQATEQNPEGIQGSKFFDNMFGDYQPCDKKEILKTLQNYIKKVNSLYVEAIKENNQQLIAG